MFRFIEFIGFTKFIGFIDSLGFLGFRGFYFRRVQDFPEFTEVGKCLVSVNPDFFNYSDKPWGIVLLTAIDSKNVIFQNCPLTLIFRLMIKRHPIISPKLTLSMTRDMVPDGSNRQIFCLLLALIKSPVFSNRFEGTKK